MATCRVQLNASLEISLAMESADHSAKDLQKIQLPAANALSPQAKPHSRASPQASGATLCQGL